MDVEQYVQRSFRVPADLMRRLKIVAAKQGKTQNEILVGMLTAYVDRHEKEGV